MAQGARLKAQGRRKRIDELYLSSRAPCALCRGPFSYTSFLGICPRFARTPHPAGGSPVSDALHMEIFHQPPIEPVLRQAPRKDRVASSPTTKTVCRSGCLIMEKKACVGVLHRVFPVGDKGLREVPPECLECPDRVSCLQWALKTREGLEMKVENMDRAEVSGMIDRLRRWSRKKDLSRLMKEREKEK